MSQFLKYIADKIIEENGNDLSDICLLFPNRRSGLFFSFYLSKKIKAPVWPPEVTTISEFIKKLSSLEVSDNLSLIFPLYDVFKKVVKTSGGFDEFYYWGEMLLNDFDNIDKYLIPPKELFYNLKSLKEIENSFSYLDEEQLKIVKSFWENFNPGKFSVHKKNFTDIWSGLAEIYYSYKKRLFNNNLAYEGMIYKEVVDNLKKTKDHKPVFSKYYFIGFNALNKCEEYIFEYFKKQDIAYFLWDYDDLYLNSTIHEAGYFIRKNLKKFPQHKIFGNNDLFDNLNKKTKEINIIAVPSDISQAKITHRILKNMPAGLDETHDKTALVLPDESLLLPVLSSVPEEFNDINITMGYPIKDTSVFSFIEFLINLHSNRRKTDALNSEFYYLDVLAILNHQYIIILEPELAGKIIALIRNDNLIYISNELFINNKLLRTIFKNQDKAAEFSSYIMDVLFFILEKDSENTEQMERSISIIEKEFIYKVYLSLKRLTDIINEQNINLGMAVLMKVLRQTISSLRIPFEGEPLKGLQIMGLLETRLLDFENLVILSVNEGVLPKKQIDSSFIPYNIRKAFDLPVAEHQDAIYAYYFYRLIQRAENIYVVYNSSISDKGISSGEISRFVSQLKIETDFKIIENNIGFDLSINPPDEILIHKTQAVVQSLNQYYSDSGKQNYLSPSAINTYIDCSLKFYFRYIAGMKETEDITEEIDPMLFGNILHKTMEKLYAGFDGKYVSSENIESILSEKEKFEETVKNAFVSVYYR
ncbi:PD-(D/E)XK nuclease family protein, partial [Bacteroidota bacterium]